jgi:uracil permease
MITGIGGSYLTGGNISAFGFELPAIATSAVLGIVLNLIFIGFDAIKGLTKNSNMV